MLGTGGFNIGGIWEERYTDTNQALPTWLAVCGRLEEAASIATNTASIGKGLKENKRTFKSWKDIFSGKSNFSSTSNAYTNNLNYNDIKKPGQASLAITNGFVLPAATDIVLQETDNANRDTSGAAGISVGAEIGLEYLTKYLVGGKGTAIDQVSHLFTNGLTGVTQNSFLLNAGVALAFGGYIPLVSITSEKSWKSSNNSANTNKNKINIASDNSQTSILSNTSTAKGASFFAKTGDNYPITYAPEYGSNIGVLSSDSTNGAEYDVVILGADIKPTSLKLFNLYSGKSSAKDTSEEYINMGTSKYK